MVLDADTGVFVPGFGHRSDAATENFAVGFPQSVVTIQSSLNATPLAASLPDAIRVNLLQWLASVTEGTPVILAKAPTGISIRDMNRREIN